MSQLNEVIHQTVRLRIMASLATLERDSEVDFVYLRDLLKLTDGNLGAHLMKLEEAGYVRSEKKFVDRIPRTYVRLTTGGRAAFEEHVEALQAIIAGKS
jgi:DNA-binding MarR family transcriptional regulator